MPTSYLEGREAHFAEALRLMVRIATVNPPGVDYLPMVEHLTGRLRALDMPPTVHRVPDADAVAEGIDPTYPRYNIIARWDVGARRTVHFNAHYDVVPVSAGDWRMPPFDGKTSGGWLYGRGAGDMKGSIVALLGAIEALQATGAAPAVNVEVSFTADEETGGALGAGWITRQGLVHADFAIECEGAAGSNVGIGHNGVLWLDVQIEGKAAHASSPERGVNAFENGGTMIVAGHAAHGPPTAVNEATAGVPISPLAGSGRPYTSTDDQHWRRLRRWRGAEGEHRAGAGPFYDRPAACTGRKPAGRGGRAC